jgi:hypothetical protein
MHCRYTLEQRAKMAFTKLLTPHSILAIGGSAGPRGARFAGDRGTTGAILKVISMQPLVPSRATTAEMSLSRLVSRSSLSPTAQM